MAVLVPGILAEAEKAMDDIKLDIRLAWNTRAPILSAKEMEMLVGMNNGTP